MANLSKIDFCQFEKDLQRSNGTIAEEEGEASDEIVSTNKKAPKLDDYKSISFGEKKELMPRFNGTLPPPLPPMS